MLKLVHVQFCWINLQAYWHFHEHWPSQHLGKGDRPTCRTAQSLQKSHHSKSKVSLDNAVLYCWWKEAFLETAGSSADGWLMKGTWLFIWKISIFCNWEITAWLFAQTGSEKQWGFSSLRISSWVPKQLQICLLRHSANKFEKKWKLSNT